MRLLSSPLQLHDVRDTEALCRGLLDRVLRGWGAHLRADEYEDALSYLIDTAWRLSGLDDRGRPRVAWTVELTWGVAGEPDRSVCVFPQEELARMWWPELPADVVEVQRTVERCSPPPGCFRPGEGLAFSTFASKILERRVVDWYRRRFGDSRYGGRPETLSLEALAEGSQRSIAEVIGGSSSDEEEVLTHVALGR